MFNYTEDMLRETFKINDSIAAEKDMHLKYLHISMITISTIVIVFGVVENILVLAMIGRHHKLHNVTNIFVASLAVSDLALCTFSLPLQLYYQLTDSWTLGERLCHIILPMLGVPVSYSMVCTMIIAIDRYILIVHPFRNRITKKTAIFIVLLTVFITFAFAVPVMVYTHYDDITNVSGVNIHKTCSEQWTQYGTLTVYTMLILFLRFLLPGAVTALLYWNMHRALYKGPLRSSQKQRNYRTSKIMLLNITLFAVFWLPWNIYSTIPLNLKEASGPYTRLIDLMLKTFALISTCSNPVLYGWLNDNFQKEVYTLVNARQYSKVSQRNVRISTTKL